MSSTTRGLDSLPSIYTISDGQIKDWLSQLIVVLSSQMTSASAGSLTQPVDYLYRRYNRAIHPLGATANFEHQDFGIIQGKFVEFDSINNTGHARPVGYKAVAKDFNRVTGDRSQSSADLFAGIDCTDINDSGMFGWIVTSGISPRTPPIAIGMVGDTVGWMRTGELTIAASNVCGRVIANGSEFAVAIRPTVGGGAESTDAVIQRIMENIADLMRQLGRVPDFEFIERFVTETIDLRTTTLEQTVSMIQRQIVTFTDNSTQVEIENALRLTQEFGRSMADLFGKMQDESQQAHIKAEISRLQSENARIYKDEAGVHAEYAASAAARAALHDVESGLSAAASLEHSQTAEAHMTAAGASAAASELSRLAAEAANAAAQTQAGIATGAAASAAADKATTETYRNQTSTYMTTTQGYRDTTQAYKDQALNSLRQTHPKTFDGKLDWYWNNLGAYYATPYTLGFENQPFPDPGGPVIPVAAVWRARGDFIPKWSYPARVGDVWEVTVVVQRNAGPQGLVRFSVGSAATADGTVAFQAVIGTHTITAAGVHTFTARYQIPSGWTAPFINFYLFLDTVDSAGSICASYFSAEQINAVIAAEAKAAIAESKATEASGYAASAMTNAQISASWASSSEYLNRNARFHDKNFIGMTTNFTGFVDQYRGDSAVYAVTTNTRGGMEMELVPIEWNHQFTVDASFWISAAMYAWVYVDCYDYLGTKLGRILCPQTGWISGGRVVEWKIVGDGGVDGATGNAFMTGTSKVKIGFVVNDTLNQPDGFTVVISIFGIKDSQRIAAAESAINVAQLTIANAQGSIASLTTTVNAGVSKNLIQNGNFENGFYGYRNIHSAIQLAHGWSLGFFAVAGFATDVSGLYVWLDSPAAECRGVGMTFTVSTYVNGGTRGSFAQLTRYMEVVGFGADGTTQTEFFGATELKTGYVDLFNENSRLIRTVVLTNTDTRFLRARPVVTATDGKLSQAAFRDFKIEQGNVATPYESSGSVKQAFTAIDTNAGLSVGYEIVAAAAGSTPALVRLKSGIAGSGVDIAGQRVAIFNPSNINDWVEVARFEGGVARINEALIRNLMVAPNNASQIFFKVQLRPRAYMGTDGTTIQYDGGKTLGAIPERIVPDTSGIALAAGEALDVKAINVTQTSFQVYAKKITPSSPSTQTSGAGTLVGGTPAVQADKPTAADAYNGYYTFQVDVTLARISTEPTVGVYGQYENYYSGYVALYANNGGGFVHIGGTWLNESTLTIGVGPSTLTANNQQITIQYNGAIGQHSGKEFGAHGSDGATVNQIDWVQYSTQNSGTVTALSQAIPFLMYPAQ